MRFLARLADPIEDIDVDVDARDRRAFEVLGHKHIGATTGMPLKDVVAAMPETYTGWLVWHALHRTDTAKAGSWNTFEARLLGVDAADEPAEVLPDPTGAAP